MNAGGGAEALTVPAAGPAPMRTTPLEGLMVVTLLQCESTGQPPPRLGLGHPSIAPCRVRRCRDGVPVLLSIQNPREWQRPCRIAEVIGRHDFSHREARPREEFAEFHRAGV